MGHFLQVLLTMKVLFGQGISVLSISIKAIFLNYPDRSDKACKMKGLDVNELINKPLPMFSIEIYSSYFNLSIILASID